MNTDKLKQLIFDNAVAMTFQTMGQYRSALMEALSAISEAPVQPDGESLREAYKEVAIHADNLHTACMVADRNEELGNVDGSLLDSLHSALDHLSNLDRSALSQSAQPSDKTNQQQSSPYGRWHHGNGILCAGTDTQARVDVKWDQLSGFYVKDSQNE